MEVEKMGKKSDRRQLPSLSLGPPRNAKVSWGGVEQKVEARKNTGDAEMSLRVMPLGQADSRNRTQDSAVPCNRAKSEKNRSAVGAAGQRGQFKA